MSYFTSDYLEFFKELAANNHKQWFDIHRDRYINVVREPFKLFVKDLLNAINTIDPEIQMNPKDAIFRINRDTRFSKDKTPYKLYNSAVISEFGRKDKSSPGLYFEFNPERIAIFGGVFTADTAQVHKIRQYISKNIALFNQLLNNSDFKQTFSTIKGKKNVRIAKEFQDTTKQQELIYNRQWYYETFLSSENILKEDLLYIIMTHYKVALPIQNFFKDALK